MPLFKTKKLTTLLHGDTKRSEERIEKEFNKFMKIEQEEVVQIDDEKLGQEEAY